MMKISDIATGLVAKTCLVAFSLGALAKADAQITPIKYGSNIPKSGMPNNIKPEANRMVFGLGVEGSAMGSNSHPKVALYAPSLQLNAHIQCQNLFGKNWLMAQFKTSLPCKRSAEPDQKNALVVSTTNVELGVGPSGEALNGGFVQARATAGTALLLEAKYDNNYAILCPTLGAYLSVGTKELHTKRGHHAALGSFALDAEMHAYLLGAENKTTYGGSLGLRYNLPD
jgi:hypothetical protein